jgi:hypothetical protein
MWLPPTSDVGALEAILAITDYFSKIGSMEINVLLLSLVIL